MLQRQIILITDSIPAANGGGISQTLYNLLDAYPAPIYIIARTNEALPNGDAIKAKILRFEYEHYKPWLNRLGKYVNPWIQCRNFELQEGKKLNIDGLPASGAAIVLVSTTDPIKLHLAWLLYKKLNYTVVPYFMDDWMAGLQLKWKQRNIHNVVAELLLQAPAWLMISPQLQQTLIHRYDIPAKACMVAHNPVEVQSLDTAISAHEGLIIYAGSIWPMHLDALVAVAKAIHLLQDNGHTQYKLRIHTTQQAWQQHQHLLKGVGVTWGGFIPYKQLQTQLQTGWLLLCTASFEAAHQAYSLSSVQTKLTDYMAAARPVLFVGPANSASGRFVEEWDCGFTMGTNNPVDIADRLLATKSMPELSVRKAHNGHEAVKMHFNKQDVQQRLYSFLYAHLG